MTTLKEQLTNNKAQDTNVMTMATPLSNHVESTEDQNKTPAELELSAKQKEVSTFTFKYTHTYILNLKKNLNISSLNVGGIYTWITNIN